MIALWNEYMKQCRLYHEFYFLFFLHDQEYRAEKQRFIKKLTGQKMNDLKKKMVELLEKVPGLDAINRTEGKFFLKRKFLNTNGIESFNSRFRPLLDSLKNAAYSTLTQARFNLFRLYINATVPFNPSRSGCAPIECYGYNLRGRSTFYLILDGLPPAQQSLEILPQKIFDLLSRKLIKRNETSCTI